MLCLHCRYAITVSNCFFLGLFLVSWHLVSGSVRTTQLLAERRMYERSAFGQNMDSCNSPDGPNGSYSWGWATY